MLQPLEILPSICIVHLSRSRPETCLRLFNRRLRVNLPFKLVPGAKLGVKKKNPTNLKMARSNYKQKSAIDMSGGYLVQQGCAQTVALSQFDFARLCLHGDGRNENDAVSCHQMPPLLVCHVLECISARTILPHLLGTFQSSSRSCYKQAMDNARVTTPSSRCETHPIVV